MRVEFDKTQKTVRDTMEQRRDREQSQCVSLGGWLRGTEAVTDLIKQNYTSDAAELLNQPDIVRHFTKVLDKMAGPCCKLVNMRDGLKEIAQVIGGLTRRELASGVQAIHATTARLVKSITTAKSSKGQRSSCPVPIDRSLGVLALAAALLPSPARAIIEDAKSLGLELAHAAKSAKGFKSARISGKVKSPTRSRSRSRPRCSRAMIIWFWLGCDADKCEMTLKVLDQMGREVGARRHRRRMPLVR